MTLNLEALKSYGFYNGDSFMSNSILDLGFEVKDDEQFEAAESFCNLLEKENKERFSVDFFNIRCFLFHYPEIEKATKSSSVKIKTLFESIKNFYKEKFGITEFDYDGIQDLIFESFNSNYHFIDYRFDCYSENEFFKFFQYIEDVVDGQASLVNFNFDFNLMQFIMTFKISVAEQDVYPCEINWKSFFMKHFAVQESDFKEEGLDSNVIQFYLNLEKLYNNDYNIEILFNGKKKKHTSLLNREINLYQVKFCKIFYNLIKKTPYEWITEERKINDWDSYFDEDSLEIIDSSLPVLESLHKQVFR